MLYINSFDTQPAYVAKKMKEGIAGTHTGKELFINNLRHDLYTGECDEGN